MENVYLFMCSIIGIFIMKASSRTCTISEEKEVFFPKYDGKQLSSSLTCFNLSDLNAYSDEFHTRYFHSITLLTAPKYIADVPKITDEITELHIEHTDLESLDTNVVEVWKYLVELHISYNKIDKIETYLLFPMIHIETVDISHNIISSIDENAFVNNKKLLKLFLNHNKIKTLRSQLFQNLVHLQVLDISNNPILDINDLTLNRQSDLLSLGISNLSLSDNELGVLKHIHNLKSLDLSYNQISNITKATFSFNVYLESLNLSHNNIQYLEDNSFNDILNLTKIRLNNNKISNFSELVFSNQKCISYLDMSDNPTNMSYKSFQEVSGLKYLFIDNAGLNDTTLLSLLHNINRKCIYHHISVTNNFINCVIPEMFSNITSITHLDISSNRIKSIDEKSFSGLFSLAYLRLQNNKISTLSSILLKDVRILKYLDLSNNQLTSLPIGIFDNSHNLLTLNLSFNELRTLNKFTLYSLKNLEELFIQNNQIFKIEGANFLYNLRTISLDNNAWKCNTLFDLLKELERTSNVTLRVISSNLNKKHHVRYTSCEISESELTDLKTAVTLPESPLAEHARENGIMLKEMNKHLGNFQQQLENNQRLVLQISLFIGLTVICLLSGILICLFIKLKRNKHSNPNRTDMLLEPKL